jgi:hypothetical protein
MVINQCLWRGHVGPMLTRIFDGQNNSGPTLPIPGEAARRSGMMPPTDSEMISPTVPR